MSDPSTMPVTVSRVLLVQDWSLQPVLSIGGTPLDDKILVSAGPNPGDLAVHMNGIDEGVFQPTGRVVVYGYHGNDTVTVLPAVTVPAGLYGGGGNDDLRPGRRPRGASRRRRG